MKSGWNKKWDDSRQSGEIRFLNLGKRTMIVDVKKEKEEEGRGRMKGEVLSPHPLLIFKECVRNP